MDKFHYSLEDWIEDWRQMIEASATIPQEQSQKWAERLFRSRYPDIEEANWKLERMLRALQYFEIHLDAFDAGGWALASRTNYTTGGDLVQALYRFFGHVTNQQVTNEPPPAFFMKLADETRNMKPTPEEK